jgi:hypothetical protein
MIETLKELSQADWEARKLKYPSLPDNARPYTKFTDKTSNGLTKCIIAWFNLSGGMAERISVTGRMIDSRKVVSDSMGNRRQIGSTKWIKPSMKKGSADVSSVFNGKSYRVEIKIGQDRQSEAQKEYEKSIQDAGGIYIIATSFDNFISQMKNS